MNVLVLHGPNLNLLGERPGDAPELTLPGLDELLARRAEALGVRLRTLQSNHEGALVDALHRERHWADGVVLNPGALAHTSYVLRDAIAAIRKPTYEVHLSDLRRREAFRRTSVLEDVRAGHVQGKGAGSYLEALEALAGSAPPATRPARPTKSIGRSKPAAASEAERPLGAKGAVRKTLGPKAARRASPTAPDGALSRADVQAKVAARLRGKLSAAELATWARERYHALQQGAPVARGARPVLEEVLARLLLAGQRAGNLSEDALIELMTRLDG